MYDIETRLRLADELVDGFCEGGWSAEGLAERAAGRLERRPGWLDALSRHIAAVSRRRMRGRSPSRLDHLGRRALVAEVERFLREHHAEVDDAIPPRIIRDLTPGRTWQTAPYAHVWPVTAIESVAELAERLELSLGQLLWLADVRGLERTVARERLRNYRYRWVPRRSGLPRLIEAPKLRLKEIQRWILAEILDDLPPHEAAHGFRRGRSVRGHAELHVGATAVLRLDLRDFFASVPAGRVFGIFRALGYAPPVAHVLTGLTTNVTPHIAWEALPRDGDPGLVGPRFHLGRRLATPHLPQGAPTSPALANLAAFGLDVRLSALAVACELRYSRYADDLTLSGESLRRGARSRSVAGAVAVIVGDEGFRLHPGKSVLRTAARRQTVTGIVVNAHPNVAREDFDRLRATLHRAARDGPAAARLSGVDASTDVRAHLNGRVAWVQALNPQRGAKLRRQFDAIDWEDG